MLPERLQVLAEQCGVNGRELRELSIAVSVSDGEPEMLTELAAPGVTELVIVAAAPAEPDDAADWVSSLAGRWLDG